MASAYFLGAPCGSLSSDRTGTPSSRGLADLLASADVASRRERECDFNSDHLLVPAELRTKDGMCAPQQVIEQRLYPASTSMHSWIGKLIYLRKILLLMYFPSF